MTNLKINKLKRNNIFQNDFNNLPDNNIIKFDKKIAVIYAPNGVGKTSFCKTLSGDGEFDIEQVTDTDTIRMNSEHFHVIHDQNGRNIIKGTAKDFLLGDNISREFELKELIENSMDNIYKDIINNLKKNGISTKTDKKIDLLQRNELKDFIKDLANNKSKGKAIDIEQFIDVCKDIDTIENDFQDSKFKFLIENSDGIVKILKSIDTVVQTEDVGKIEEHSDAINLLEKYQDKNECVVCDSDIDSSLLLAQKQNKKETLYNALDICVRKIIDEILNKIATDDPFNIKDNLLQAIQEGTTEKIDNVKQEIAQYENYYNNEIENLFSNCINDEIQQNVREWKLIRENQPEFSSEDLLYIEQIIENNIGKSIKVIRDETNTLKLTLEDKEFLQEEREKLELSAGEQNFISLTFELLKAKNSRTEVIIIDDPISSFDSIYKNKLVYSLVKFLENKKQIILTHNTDVLRLLEVQFKDCFNLYLFNNFENQVNGFIPVNSNEKNLLLYIPQLLEYIRNEENNNNIQDMRTYLVSLIPFMRGYANLIGDNESKNKLTKCMHGYFEEQINIKEIFNAMFEQNITEECIISANDIINIDLNDIEETIIDMESYPLLNKTLYHSYVYLYLRLNVEKKLVDKYNINTNRFDNLGNIIREAYREMDTDTDDQKKEKIRAKVLLTSKKTLLNEFNHFDGNMSLFQPAIDISDYILEKEKREILEFLNNLD